MNREDAHIAQIEAIAEQLGWPDTRFNDVACDAAAIRRMGDMAFLWAIADFGTDIYWFHLTPNPRKNLRHFLKVTHQELPNVRHYIVGLASEPIDVTGASAREILEHFHPDRSRP